MEVLERIPPLRLDRSRQTAPQVFEALRELIVSVALEPGMVLPRAELAGHYGISQTPIRDALLRLGEDGLVDIFPQHATLVSRIDIAAALQAHFLRRSIELEILHTLCALPPPAHAALVARLRALLRRQAEALQPLDFAALAAADQAFHRELYQAADVGPLWDLVRQRSGHVDRLRRLNLPARGKAEAIVRDHTAITDALERADAPAAEAALRQHLSGTLSFIDQVRQRYPDWIT
jgi:DNA-binding GntR family transcriptional regulator